MPSSIATAEATAFARRMSEGKLGNDEFWSRCLGQGFLLDFDEVPDEIDIGDLWLLQDHVAPDRYSTLEAGAKPTKEETHFWIKRWVSSRLNNPGDYGVKNIDALHFKASDGWSGVLILSSRPCMLENAEYDVWGLYESLQAAKQDLQRTGHLKL
jgi:hypothetical protein